MKNEIGLPHGFPVVWMTAATLRFNVVGMFAGVPSGTVPRFPGHRLQASLSVSGSSAGLLKVYSPFEKIFIHSESSELIEFMIKIILRFLVQVGLIV